MRLFYASCIDVGLPVYQVTHNIFLNNALAVGRRLKLTHEDVVSEFKLFRIDYLTSNFLTLSSQITHRLYSIQWISHSQILLKIVEVDIIVNTSPGGKLYALASWIRRCISLGII